MDTNHQYFDCLCRTCMNELEATPQDNNTKPQQQWNSIFDRVQECGAFKIAKLLSYAVPQIKVKLSDELPKRICCKCLQQLLNVYRFQQMCVQSEQQMRQRIPNKQTDPGIPAAATVSEIGTNHLSSFQSSSTDQNIEHTSIQEPLLETTEQVVKPEAAETSDVEIDKLLEDCRDSQGNLSEFVKNEPIEDDDPEMEYSADDTIQSIISVKDEVMSVEAEEQQVIETNVKAQQKAAYEGLKRENCDICGKSIRKKCLKNHKLTHGGERAHKCDFCEKRFIQRSNLRSHMRTHTGDKPYKCKYCERSFSHGSHHIKHMRVHFGGYVYRCELCPLAFLLASELRIHLTTHENEDPETRVRNMKALQEAETKLQLDLSKKETQPTLIEESEPQFEIKAKKNVKKHHSRHAEDDMPCKCPSCTRKFNTISNMYQQKARHEVACDICGKCIVKSSLRNHKLTHSNEKAHKCDFCGKRFNRITSMRLHIRTHTGEKPYKCKYCERSFHDRSNHRSHMRVHLGDNIYRCELCPLAFPAAKKLHAHSTEHKNEDSETRERNMKALQDAEDRLQLENSKEHIKKAPKCDFCGKCFTVISVLRRHMRKHTGEKPYKCKYCERTFHDRSNHRSHMRVHLGDNIYRCELCPLAFPAAKKLHAHSTEHKNEDSETRERNMKALQDAEDKLQLENSKEHIKKAPKCDFCGKCFTVISVLRRHMRKHTGEKPYKCKYCERSFSDPSHRMKHMRLHLGDNVHRCKLCPLAFPLAKELRAHLTEHSNDDSEAREQNMRALQEAEAKLQLELSKKETG